MVFGKLKGYDWWPGLIITFKEAMQRPSLENCYWVRWFGDHKVSEVCASMESPKSDFGIVDLICR